MSTWAKLAATAFVATAVVASTGCYRPEGSWMPSSGDAYTYFSTETAPKSLLLRDLRSGEVFFSIDIPVGSQLTMQFKEGDGDDPVYTPDLLTYQTFDIGTSTGKLRNSMSVPNAASRRIEISMRPAPEYVNPEPDRSLRTDEMADRPDWWTPEGGEMPENNLGLWNYED